MSEAPATPVDSDGWTPSALERAAYRHRRARRSGLVALLSTLVLGTVLVVGITATPGWPRVQETFFSPERPGRPSPPSRRGSGSKSG